MTPLTTHPTFIDLRAFAANAAAGTDPFGADRTILPLREAPVEVGAIALAAGTHAAGALSGDWWLVAAQGTVSIAANDRSVRLEGAQSCVMPSGTAFTCTCEAPATLIYIRYLHGSDSVRAIVPIDLEAELAPSGAPLAELLLTPPPSCRNHTDFRSSDGAFTCGVWDSTPYHRRAMRYVHFELMVLLAGSVTFIDERGESGTFAKGAIFLVEQGASCSWESREDVAKVYAIYREPA